MIRQNGLQEQLNAARFYSPPVIDPAEGEHVADPAEVSGKCQGGGVSGVGSLGQIEKKPEPPNVQTSQPPNHLCGFLF